MNYFYRLNAAGLGAGLKIRQDDEEGDPDYPSRDLDNHLQQFWDTLHDKAVAETFKYTEYRTLAQVEKVLSRREYTQVKPKSKPEKKRAGMRRHQ